MDVVMVHGSVETSDKAFMLDILKGAALQGSKFLPKSPVDAAECAVRVMEDDPHLNAGYGSVLNLDGEVEMDASIMDGLNNRCGAVCVVKGIKNPVSLARLVMEETPHVILAGEGATKFAQRKGFQTVDMVSPEQRNSYELAMELIKQGKKIDFSAFTGLPKGHDTVGCVVSSNGHLVAASSTGGSFLKIPGRVGDTPIIGGGIYASKHCAVVCTGLGEAFIETAMAKWVEHLVAAGMPPQQAARQAILKLNQKKQAPGGVLVVDSAGSVGAAHNTGSFPVGLVINGQVVQNFKPERIDAATTI
ncbi:isoaspartyl peptidase/L-asparaginase family protein [Desulfofalx alkaliphila]|uniref:isoaspartyl peptidase/L-asparaginase family protein n=1 Tax=Desulfofalx alkaliphila TaxID=105483 RepID=UPI00068D64CF|nr:isoaspartyl peptidase/L-asparaginase family protein [Desulfofalx alkaliphila]